MHLKPQTQEYLAQSGKLHMDIVLISQNFSRLDTIARDLTERVREFHCLGGGATTSYRGLVGIRIIKLGKLEN